MKEKMDKVQKGKDKGEKGLRRELMKEKDKKDKGEKG